MSALFTFPSCFLNSFSASIPLFKHLHALLLYAQRFFTLKNKTIQHHTHTLIFAFLACYWTTALYIFFNFLESIVYDFSASSYLPIIPPLLYHSTGAMYLIGTGILLIPKSLCVFFFQSSSSQ